MKKLIFTALLSGAALGMVPAYVSDARAEGEAPIRADSAMNTDAPSGEATSTMTPGQPNSNYSDPATTRQSTDIDTQASDRSADADPNADAAATTANSGASAVSASGSMDTASVSELQQDLRSEGYRVAVDGVWGPQTESALREFQTANNLTASGMLNAETQAALDK